MATINGTSGNDELDGTRLADMIKGLGGHDELDGEGGNDGSSAAGNDEIDGDDGDDRFGGAGNDETRRRQRPRPAARRRGHATGSTAATATTG